MRKTAIALVLVVLTGLSTAVVGGPEAGEGEMAITSTGSSASASTTVGPNGTKWRTEVADINNSCMSGNQSESFQFGEFTGVEDNLTSIEFSGTLQTSNPCHMVNLEVTKESEDSYRVDIKDEAQEGPCEMCIGAVKFEASFAAPEDYRVTFTRDGETLETRETSGYSDEGSSDEQEEEDRTGVREGFSKIFSWLGSLF